MPPLKVDEAAAELSGQGAVLAALEQLCEPLADLSALDGDKALNGMEGLYGLASDILMTHPLPFLSTRRHRWDAPTP